MVVLQDPERLIWRQREVIERQRAAILQLGAALENRDREIERAARECEHWRHVSQENARLREQLQEAYARADTQADYAVYVVPGARHLQSAMQDLHGEARDGDRIRLGDSSAEYVMRGGMWERA